MPGEKRQVAGSLGEQEALGGNWKSAQCVTSLYDSYIQLQQENEELRENGRRFQQENDLLAAQSKQNQLRDPEDTRCEALEQEIRLLRSEKTRMEETHRLELQKLEARATNSEATQKELVAKYQERFEFDPLENKRAAMAVKSMQNSLQNALLEKEELGIRCGELMQQYRTFQKEQFEIVQTLKEQVRILEQQRVRSRQQRVVNALSTWSTSKIHNAWTKWTNLVKEQQQKEENKTLMTSFEVKTDECVAKIRRKQAALFAMKLLQQSARQSFLRWRFHVRQNVERRRKGNSFVAERDQKRARSVLNRWRMECMKTKALRIGVLKIEKLVSFRSRSWGIRQWSVQTFRLALVEKESKLNSVSETIQLQDKAIKEFKKSLNEAQNAISSLEKLYGEEQLRCTAQIETQKAAELAIRQKLGRFFTKQTDRLLIKDVLREWKVIAIYLRGMNQRTDLASKKLQIYKLRRSIHDWHFNAHQTHKNRVQSQQILRRMRQIGVLKCFNSWKERVREHKLRKVALLHALNRIRNRGIAQCFTQWKAFCDQRMTLRQALKVIATCALKQHAVYLLSTWRERVIELKIEAEVRHVEMIQHTWENRLVQAKNDLNCQQQCFTRWHDTAFQRKKQNILVKKCLSRLKNGSLARVLGSWKGFVQCRKARQELVRKWVNRCHTGVLQRAWNRLQRQIVLKEQQLLMFQLQTKRDAELNQLSIEFEEYRKAQQMLCEELEMIQIQQEKELQETNARFCYEVKRVQRLSGAVTTLCTTRERNSSLIRFFRAWRTVIYKRKIVQKFQITVNFRQKFALASKWKLFTTQKKKMRAVFKMIHSCFSRWWQIQCFKAWNEARRQNRAIKVFSTLLIHNSETNMCRNVLSGWRKLAKTNILLRWTVEKIWLNSVHAKMKQQFTHWMAFTKAEAAKEQLEKRNVALTAIQAKVWWKQSVSMMRFVFSEWKNTVVKRKKQRLAERKLLIFQQNNLVTRYFTAWTEFMMVKGRENERNQRFTRWLRKIFMRKQERAMGVWKMLLLRNQQQDLNELKKLKNVQEEEIYSQKEEILVLKEAAAETERKLAYTLVVHGESTMKVQYITNCGLVAKYFNALKLKVAITKYQRQAVHFCHNDARRRHLAELFSNWYSFSQKNHAVKLAVVQKFRRCGETLTRTILREWQLLASQQRVFKQKQLKLQKRIRSRVLVKTFVGWNRTIHRQRDISTTIIRLESIAQKMKLMRMLSFWYQKLLQKKRLILQEQEKHKKIIQFLVGRQETAIMRTFHFWKQFAQSKSAIRSHVNVCYSTKCHEILAESWKSWFSAVKTVKSQRKCVQMIQSLSSKFYYRIAFSRWRRYQFAIQIAVLQTGNEALTNQVEESSRRLLSANLSVVELQDKLNEAELCSSAMKMEITSQEVKNHRQLSCFNILSKMMMKRTKCKEVSEAFALWRTKLYILRSKSQALANVVKIRRRRSRWFAFWLWKVKTLRLRRLESMKKLWENNDLLTMVLRWRKYYTIQAKIRLFLTKRVLLAQTKHNLPISIAFSLWKTKASQITAFQQVKTLNAKLLKEQNSSSAYLRKLALGKWSWLAYNHRLRQMRSFLSHCYTNSIKTNAAKHRLEIAQMQEKSESALVKLKEESEAITQQKMGALSAAEEQLTTGASFQALQTLIRRLFQPLTVKELFVSVASTFAQILHGSAAVLFLFDPSSNELWTQREENQLIQVPASLGIAGSTLSSGSTLVIADIAADSRFHPMVDQFVLNGLQDAAISMQKLQTKPTIGLVSCALLSTDGAVYGILQVAFPTSNLSAIDRRVQIAQTQLYAKTCCFYVEQIVFEMLRNCRDRVRARIPDKFIKLFKQNKNWRKYYAAIERKASELDHKLCSLLEERKELIQSKMELQKCHQQVQNKLQSTENSTKDVNKLILGWKKKLTKWQQILAEKDREIVVKTNELQKKESEFARYRREQRAKELQSALIATDLKEKSPSLSEFSLLKADETRLKSQLIRAEADNLLLVKAISIARTQHGELPTTIQAEVSRVATRVSRRVPSRNLEKEL